MDISTNGRRPGLAAPEAAPESGKPTLAKPASLVQTSSAARNSRPSTADNATAAPRDIRERLSWSIRPAYIPWTDRELERAVKRMALFRRRGLAADDAEALADRLVCRDRERDDRRCCIECSELQQTGECFRRLPTSRTQLVRCVGFIWATP